MQNKIIFDGGNAKPLSYSEFKDVQRERLVQTVRWAGRKSNYYRTKFQAAGVNPDDFNDFGDLARLPFTPRDEIFSTNMHDFLTLPLSSVDRIALWGDGNPTIKACTARDIAAKATVFSRALRAAGMVRSSNVGIVGSLPPSAMMDLTTALISLGMNAVLLGTNYHQALRVMEIAGVEAVIGETRSILQLIVEFQAARKDFADYPLKTIICLDELLQNSLMNYIETRTNAKMYQINISYTLGIVGMFFQCQERTGFHVAEPEYYLEIVSLDDGRDITNTGDIGEVVITTLASETMPLIRYKTGQMARCIDKDCSCGSGFIRISAPAS